MKNANAHANPNPKPKPKTWMALLTAASLGVMPAVGRTQEASEARALAEQALSPDAAVRSTAVAQLRADGPAGLDALLLLHDARPPGTLDPVRRERLATAVDAVAGQYGAAASRLFWYTDLEEAKAAARMSGRPILSLRLLGRLDQELSCANSRFFRVVLYANREVSQVLRSRFVLHWQSERPVPRITVDFGDGRRLERTVTGNSIHYVLDEQGRPVDALPGLYGPRAFLGVLETAEAAARASARMTDIEALAYRRGFHRERRRLLLARWQRERTAVGLGWMSARGNSPTAVGSDVMADADQAERLALSKAFVEAPLVAAVLGRPETRDDASTSAWSRLAAFHAAEARLDAASRRVMRDQGATDQAMARLEQSLAEDTVRNEYVRHLAIHERLAGDSAGTGLEALDRWVYDALFLTPRQDPWLGLLPRDTYAGLSHDGVSTR